MENRWVDPWRVLGVFLALTAALGVAGCASSKANTAAEEPPCPIVERVSLGPGDEVELKFFYAPDLNDIQRIRPDGKLSLQLVGEVMAYGRTPGGLEATLKELYKPYMENPEVTVIVRELNSRVVYVGGAVGQPGRVAMPGRLTLLGAIMEAGGIDPVTAKADSVCLVRHDVLGNRTVEKVDLEKAMKGSVITYLEPQDIVYVPRTTIVNVNQWIDQHINKIVPQFGFTYTRTASDGRSTVGLDTSSAR